MRRDIFINVSPFEKRIALLEDNRLIELVVDKPDNQRIVGNIYKGRVVSVLPGMQAAFVDIGLEKAAFLHAADVAPAGGVDFDDNDDSDDDIDPRRRDRAEKPIDQLLREGQEILVQVVKEPISTKGAKVTGYLSLAGRFLVCMPNTTFIGVSKKSRDHGSRRQLKRLVQDLRVAKDVGYIVRTNGLNETEDEFKAEMNMLEGKWEFIKSVAAECEAPRMVLEESEAAVGILRDYFSEKVDKVVVDDKDFYQKTRAYIRQLSPDLVSRVHLYDEKTPMFDVFQIEQDVEKVYQDKVWIRKGSHLVIQTTEAMTTIDVNTGRNVGRDDQAATIFDTNVAAAKEIAKQLRLRDLGGIIVVDFIDMDSEDDRDRLVKEFKKALRGDRAPITVASQISQFGLLEMTRKRVREALVKTVSEPCSHCGGGGNVLLPSSVVAALERWIRRSQAKNGPKELTIIVHSRIIDYLVAERSYAFHHLERFGVKLDLVEDPDAPADSFRIFHSRSLEELTPQHNQA
ncbi:MAG: Rne/Rng family ribonuclease [Fibrobacterota bacterium]|nr:Rne/Rng family ribonuclease [Fibrobacterota bacterium]QQS07026.1 MAG: Rne/Rng family ribonuclease [Fibrobacterota bacterium]